MTPRLARWLTALAVAFAAAPASAQLGADAQKAYDDFERLAPHRAFALAADTKGYLWAGANGADPGGAVPSALKTCEERSKMDDARAAFAASGVQALMIAEPHGFSGHGAAGSNTFPRTFGACIHAFIETGARQAPCS